MRQEHIFLAAKMAAVDSKTMYLVHHLPGDLTLKHDVILFVKIKSDGFFFKLFFKTAIDAARNMYPCLM